LCIDACPTDAIVEEYVVDSNRCISYLTIEHRGEIEGVDPENFDGWIYGCDICQDVCPWNDRFSVRTSEQRFEPRDGNQAPLLDKWIEMTEEEYREKFRGSAMKRAKYDGLMRNVRFLASALTTKTR
jgi:epoxyqueuosine reductase